MPNFGLLSSVASGITFTNRRQSVTSATLSPISPNAKQPKPCSDLAEQPAQAPVLDITVAIPTHNGAVRLPLVLRSAAIADRHRPD